MPDFNLSTAQILNSTSGIQFKLLSLKFFNNIYAAFFSGLTL